MIVSFSAPEVLGDKNEFLKNFVNHELIATLGFMATITLGFTTSIHFELNHLESKTNNKFQNARGAIKRSAYSIILLLLMAFFIVITKPIVVGLSLNEFKPVIESVFNSSAITIFVFFSSVLFDITKAVFRIPPLPQ